MQAGRERSERSAGRESSLDVTWMAQILRGDNGSQTGSNLNKKKKRTERTNSDIFCSFVHSLVICLGLFLAEKE